MKKFVLVDESGQPLYTTVPSDWTTMEDGTKLIEGTLREYAGGEDDSFILASVYWKEGWKVRPVRPSNWHTWDTATESWLPNLDAARESQRQAWNVWRDRELIAGYTHNGHVFHSDDTFIGELQLILKGYERGHLTGTSAIRTRDNAVLQMTHVEIESLLLLIGLHRQAIYAQSWAGKDALAGLTTLEDIMAGGPPA